MATVAAVVSRVVAGLEPVGKPDPGRTRFSEVLAQAAPRTPAPHATPAASIDGISARIEAGRKRLDQIIAEARGGRTYSPRELLSLQAEVYRVVEEVSLAQRVVEEGLSSLKRVWTMQI